MELPFSANSKRTSPRITRVVVSPTELAEPNVLCCVGFAGMSCSQSQISSLNPDVNSSDYGSDFTPDEEALVDELLGSVATEDAVPDTDRTAPAAAGVDSPIGNFEDYYASVPWELERKRSDAVVPGAIGLSAQETGVADTTLG